MNNIPKETSAIQHPQNRPSDKDVKESADKRLIPAASPLSKQASNIDLHKRPTEAFTDHDKLESLHEQDRAITSGLTIVSTEGKDLKMKIGEYLGKSVSAKSMLKLRLKIKPKFTSTASKEQLVDFFYGHIKGSSEKLSVLHNLIEQQNLAIESAPPPSAVPPSPRKQHSPQNPSNTPEIEQVILKELEPFKALSATGMLEYEVDEKNGQHSRN